MTGADVNLQMFSLASRVALVTGASRGLGWEIALGFARAGAHVLINSRSSEHVGGRVEELQRMGLQASALAFDVADAAAVSEAFKEIERRHGRLDILVNNVGARLRIPLDQTSAEDFGSHLQVNLTAAFNLTQQAARLMALNAHGRIIMMTSIVADRAATGNIAYIAAKGGLAAITRAFACEYGPLGITCNAISPGAFLTETNADALSGAAREGVERRVPLRRCGNPRELAGPALFLASDAASYVTGQVLTVDGGFTISL